MKPTHSLKQKTMQLIQILLPILVTQVSLLAMNFFDTVMSGRAGANDLAGVAIGSSLWMPAYTGLSGILLALTPIVAQLVGGEQREQVPYQVMQGIYLAAALSVSIIAIGYFALPPVLALMQLDPAVQRIAHDYLGALAWGIIPLFVYAVLRCFIDALGRTSVTMVITLISVPVNVGLNYLLIFGKWGFPRLGGVGAGYATAVTCWVICLIAIAVIQRLEPFAGYRVFGQWPRLAVKTWLEQLKIGVPIGFAIFFETSIFAAVTLLMSEFGTAAIAAHQAALNFASLLYMIPFSIASALTIAVGFEVGARRWRDARQYSYLGVSLAVAMALVLAVGLYLFREQVANLYTTDPEVLQWTRQFLLYAIFFQLSDAIAAPIQGALRGYKDVNATFLMAFISYWLLGLPVGYALANYTSFGAYGYWLGLISGLAFGALFLSGRLLWKQRRQQRLDSR